MQRRTSYFPGLGWMLRRELWLEIGREFPDQAWDHWMRLNTTSKGELQMRPENMILHRGVMIRKHVGDRRMDIIIPLMISNLTDNVSRR